MSQVLRALQQSQREFEQVSLHSRAPYSRVQQPTSNRLFKTVLSLVVGVGLGGAAHVYVQSPSLASYLHHSLLVMTGEKHTQEAVPMSQDTRIDAQFELIFLPKPDFAALAPLPKSDNQIIEITEGSVLSSGSEWVIDIKPSPPSGLAEGEWVLPELDLSGLSPELASRVSDVLDKSSSYSAEEFGEQSNVQVVELDLSGQRYVGRLPALNLQTHMYASNSTHRWVKINGTEIQEGMIFEGEIKLLEIAPRYILIEFLGETIKIPALYDWNG